ncbi:MULTISPECIES: hypothetical protein [unclassified Sphingopyxis]|uniref:hypothetical protein n=1 Tax=unclassified Sphingopyxis TaxID=2614943 RepID=UPI00285BDF0D|nr:MULTISPECIES: hypothetical protein [unclassified Sphingopyxis]MDR6833607.1 hypothetical protein [Sphingopyxis sp. BE122]MDR7225876.1 hypothetical protein [Sphingopyxis sp. BE259]
MPGLAKESAEIAARNGLLPSAGLELLVDQIFGLSCRDQEERYNDPRQMASRRSEGFRLAKRMQAEATQMLVHLEKLYGAYKDFHAAVRFHPALLEEIFDVNIGDPDELFLPAQLNILQTAFYDETDLALTPVPSLPEQPSVADAVQPCPPFLWESIDARLQALTGLPVKAALARGPVPNLVLQKAVERCRSHWVKCEGRSWSMSSLKVREVRDDNDDATLKGSCERFVVDVLRVAGLRFNLSDLASAWDAVDRNYRTRARDNKTKGSHTAGAG